MSCTFWVFPVDIRNSSLNAKVIELQVKSKFAGVGGRIFESWKY